MLPRNAQLVRCSTANTYVRFYSLCSGMKLPLGEDRARGVEDFQLFGGATPFNGFASKLLNLEILSSALECDSLPPMLRMGIFADSTRNRRGSRWPRHDGVQ
jgi:hypothetical protein